MTLDPDPALVPELLVLDVQRSIDFWCGLCGFEVLYSRPEERFAYVALGSAHLMLEQIGVGRNWVTGSLEAPLGRGINFQIAVPDAAALSGALLAAGIELFMPLETRRYAVGEGDVAVRQFLVSDPDGYLVRFQSSMVNRDAAG